MSNYELLNNIKHKDLRILAEKSAELGDKVGGCWIFPPEVAEVQKEYPIFFQKDAESGKFQAVAIFGFNQDENLFLTEEGWNADYIPAIMEKEPFLIGFQKGDSGEPTPVIHVDMDSPRISKDNSGVSVFLEHGGNSPYLDRVERVLNLIHEGISLSNDMFDAFLSFDLVEPFVLNIEFDKGVQYSAKNYYTINQDKFHSLDDESLGRLHRVGYLQAAYMVIASMSNVQKLIDRRNKNM